MGQACVAMLSTIDVISQFLCQYGLTVAGSSLYIVIYSSCTIWIALEATALYRLSGNSDSRSDYTRVRRACQF